MPTPTLAQLLSAMAAKSDASAVHTPDRLPMRSVSALGNDERALNQISQNDTRTGISSVDRLIDKSPTALRKLAIDPGVMAGNKLNARDYVGAAKDVAMNVPEVLGPLAKVGGLGAIALRTGRAAEGEKALLKAIGKSPKAEEIPTGIELMGGKHQSYMGKRLAEEQELAGELERERLDNLPPEAFDEEGNEIRPEPKSNIYVPRITVSTRMPTAKKALENPHTQNLLVGLESSRMDPQTFENNARLIAQYPNMPKKLMRADPEEIAQHYINSSKDNLLWLHDQVPEPIRERSKQWYDGAHKITKDWAAEHEVSHPAVAGVAAVLSPQKDWFMNADLAKRVINTAMYQHETPWTPQMSETADRIFGKPQYEMLRKNIAGRRLADLQDPIERAAWLRTFDEAHNPRTYPIVHPEGEFGGPFLTQKGQPGKVAWGSLNEIAKALNILDNPSMENISRNLGGQHKVRNFFNNIIDPNSLEGHVTADTHAVAANLLRPLSGKSTEVAHNFGSGGASNSSVFGSKGTYGLNADAYRAAAGERGILPREMQSITWEAIRGMFPSTFKSEANVKDIDAIWQQFRKGKLSLDDARRLVSERAGGIRNPTWYKP